MVSNVISYLFLFVYLGYRPFDFISFSRSLFWITHGHAIISVVQTPSGVSSAMFFNSHVHPKKEHLERWFEFAVENLVALSHFHHLRMEPSCRKRSERVSTLIFLIFF